MSIVSTVAHLCCCWALVHLLLQLHITSMASNCAERIVIWAAECIHTWQSIMVACLMCIWTFEDTKSCCEGASQFLKYLLFVVFKHYCVMTEQFCNCIPCRTRVCMQTVIVIIFTTWERKNYSHDKSGNQFICLLGCFCCCDHSSFVLYIIKHHIYVKKLQFIHVVHSDGSKTAKIIKRHY